MTKTVTQITSRSQSTHSPALWAERAPIAPFHIDQVTVFCNAAGHATRIERQTIAHDNAMIGVLGQIEAYKPSHNACSHTFFEALDATGHSVHLMDLGLVMLGREAFDRYVNG